MPDDITDRPSPASKSDGSRWRYTSLVHRMLSGLWKDDAQERLQSLFDRSVWPSLAPPETSRNAFLSIVQQKAIMYDEPPEVTATGEPDLSPIERPELWPLMQQTLRFAVGMNECLMRVDWREGVGITYRVVTPDSVVAVASMNRPDTPERIEELRWRSSHGWTWEVWDIRNPAQPVFRIEADDPKRGRIDITREAMPEHNGEYPYRDRSGAPILPYVLYHARVGNRLWDPFHGSEVVHGTLTAAALWTMWITGVRDGAHPQRVVIDGEIVGGSVNTGSTAGSQKGVRQIALTQTAILPILSRGERQAAIDQWAPAMEPESAAKSLESFETGLAVHAGISPADITRGSAGQSGYSIVVSREGQRMAQRRLEPPMSMGDSLLLATAARIHNAAAGGDLPESSDDYAITYHRPKQSPDEIRATIEGASALLDDLLITPADAYRKFHPGATDEQAIAAMIESATQKKQIADAIAAAAGPPPPPTPPPAIPSDEAEDDDTTNPDDSEEDEE